MPEQMKPLPARDMHKYVLGLVGVFTLLVGTFPLACLRVSQDQRFADVRFHVKSLTLEGKLAKSSGESVAIEPSVNQFSEQILASGSTTDQTVQPSAIAADPIITNNSTDRTVQLEKGTINPTSPVSKITDLVQLRALNQKLYDQIAQVWQAGRRFEQPLVYRVTLTHDGAIASLKPVNQLASSYLQQTPLPNLLKPSTTENSSNLLVDFRVEFTRQGILEVSPWQGFGK